MTTPKLRTERRNRQASEAEANQVKLRASIAESQRLVREADDIVRRHRKEWDDEDPDDG